MIKAYLKYVCAISFVMSSALIASAYSAENASIRLVDSIAVRAPFIELGEIAVIECENEAFKKDLMSLRLEKAPSAGSSRIISSFKVEAVLAKAGFGSFTNVFGEQSAVKIEERLVSDNEMLEIIKTWIEKNIAGNTEAEIDFIRLPNGWNIPQGKGVKIEIQSNRRNKKVGGDIGLTLRAVSGSQVLSTTKVRAHVSLYREAAVLVHPVKRKQQLSSQDFELRRADVTESEGMEIKNAEDFLGMEAKRDLPVGSVISVRDFKAPIIAKRGSMNRIFVKNNSVGLTISGAKALENGKKGEHILFSNPMNKRKPIRAKVVKEGIALLDLH